MRQLPKNSKLGISFPSGINQAAEKRFLTNEKEFLSLGCLRNAQKREPHKGCAQRICGSGLPEVLCHVKMPFIFKGGISLLILLDEPRRFSTDIDIIVAPGPDVDGYIQQAGQIFPFRDVKENIRKGTTASKNGISISCSIHQDRKGNQHSAGWNV